MNLSICSISLFILQKTKMSNYWHIPVRLRGFRTVIIIMVCVSLVIVFNIHQLKLDIPYKEKTVHISISMHNFIVDQFYQSHKYWTLSKLGNVLYKNEDYPEISEERRNNTFVILIWKHWKFLQLRHLFYFGKVQQDPLEGCSVKNCEFTGDDDKLESADAVIVHLHRGDIPPSDHRNSNQRWIFLNDEAPGNAFSLSRHKVALSSLHNVFNWSMTYRSDSDVPVPYGRTVGLKSPKVLSSEQFPYLIPNWKRKRRDVLVAILVSNCGVPYRNNLIKGLKEHMQIDVHGACGTDELKKSCPGHFRADCDEMSYYLFYLALENSKCSQYITEKLFHNAYSRGAIPIIQGPSVEDCQHLLPPNSYLHVDNYSNLKELAEDIVRISKSEKDLLFYHEWRNDFEVLNEHGFFGTKSFHLCRVCEAMNYNDDLESVYSEKRIFEFLSSSLLCRK